MTRNAERDPMAGAPFENNVQQDGRAGSADVATRPAGDASAARLVGFVWILLGGPGAAQDRAMLRECPLTCGAVHMFYVPAGTWRNGQPIVRAPRCAPHRRMELRVTAVLPHAVAVAGQRRRGVA